MKQLRNEAGGMAGKSRQDRPLDDLTFLGMTEQCARAMGRWTGGGVRPGRFAKIEATP
jgi:hypothetical protein